MSMLTATQCLAKANQLEAYALQCGDPMTSDAYAELAIRWRSNAIIARQQDAWTSLHTPD
jgi:diphthamide biosynthesis methyltransferase